MSVYIASVMTFFKLFVQFGIKNSHIEGLPVLLDILNRTNQSNQGLLTFSNHISTLDDPLVWTILPWYTYFNPFQTRWTLGAADILFTNRFISPFFSNGQVIRTVRGNGIFQPAIDQAINKLDRSQWVHIFPEGRVNQLAPDTSQLRQGHKLLRFKWGISRLVLESQLEPIILPIWLQGFDRVMPEKQPFPRSFIPRFNQTISIKISNPIQNPQIKRIRNQYRCLLNSFHSNRPESLMGLRDSEAAREMRIEIATLLRSELDAIQPQAKLTTSL
ncbi:hypothetical protein O181_027553 [Austropuccinia psidii MF-1]|uniref:Tafazzin family protein n=1 Tax=Austropuccinia psidii MF-1 TaxID=1389203 RepID=A0A9Q3H113_9BASI|nr:hypothetical protein [Austropuccinia psidii MF-1]